MQRGFGAFLLLASAVLAQDDNDVLLLQKSLAVEEPMVPVMVPAAPKGFLLLQKGDECDDFCSDLKPLKRKVIELAN
jgi:hypothetical protein